MYEDIPFAIAVTDDQIGRIRIKGDEASIPTNGWIVTISIGLRAQT